MKPINIQPTRARGAGTTGRSAVRQPRWSGGGHAQFANPAMNCSFIPAACNLRAGTSGSSREKAPRKNWVFLFYSSRVPPPRKNLEFQSRAGPAQE